MAKVFRNKSDIFSDYVIHETSDGLAYFFAVFPIYEDFSDFGRYLEDSNITVLPNTTDLKKIRISIFESENIIKWKPLTRTYHASVGNGLYYCFDQDDLVGVPAYILDFKNAKEQYVGFKLRWMT